MQDEKRYVQVEEIAEKLAVPRHFMGKILKNLVKEGVISSIKGPSGGFTVNDQTLQFTLYRIFAITDGLDTFHNCVLRVKECNSTNPCPMHTHMEEIKSKMKAVLINTTFNDLLSENKDEFIKSISTEADGFGFDEFIFSKEVY